MSITVRKPRESRFGLLKYRAIPPIDSVEANLMSQGTAFGHQPDFASSRRWQRYKVNVPIRVIVCRAMRASIFDGRGTSLSAGGMALFAGAELRPGDQVAV